MGERRVHGRGGDRRRGFTLVEILIVVVILSVLAALVVPNMAGASVQATQTTFVRQLKNWVDAAHVYMAATKTYLPDGSSGEVPAGFGPFIDPEGWTGGTPIGGVWDAEYEDNGVTSAIGVHFDGTGETRDDAYMTEIDGIFDGGDLATGSFRKLSDARYYFVIE